MMICCDFFGSLSLVLLGVFCLANLPTEVHSRSEPRWAPNSLRLVGGSVRNEGRLEIYFEGRWGSICNDLWDFNDGAVACRQLGYYGVDNIMDARDGFESASESTPILLDNLQCNGTEEMLAECPHTGLGIHNCGHYEDVAVVCVTEETRDGEIRLMGGSSAREGRVEIFHDRQWGTICMDSFEMNNVMTVCAQVGLSYAVRALESDDIYGKRNENNQYSNIWLLASGIRCKGNERLLGDCPNAGWGNSSYSCRTNKQLAVICSSKNSSDDITLSERVRLVGGKGEHEGRVEVFHAAEWGTVCDDSWSFSAGHVVCKQLGFPSVSTIIHGSQWSGLDFGGPGNGTIWLTTVTCSYSPPSLYSCAQGNWGSGGCDHSEDAGVVCNTDVTTNVDADGSLRLANGESGQGRLEIAYDGLWGTVCDDSFGIIDAHVACRQLGYTQAVELLASSRFGAGSGPIWLDNLGCSGNETALTNCSHDDWGINNCGHIEDVAIRCLNGTPADGEYDLRLVGGESPGSGRLEIFANGIWGTVCNDRFDITDATVACLQMGYDYANWFTDASTLTDLEAATNPIYLDELECIGYEERLIDCTHIGLGVHNCGHSEDIAIFCTNSTDGSQGPNQGDLRLVDGPTPDSGRLEVYNQYDWGTVCDDYFEEVDGMVACKQLGFTGLSRLVFEDIYNAATGTVWLDDLACSGTEERLIDCSNPGLGVENCGHSEDVGLVCSNETDPSGIAEGNIRLVGGRQDNEGRLEVYYGRQWGTICDDYFTLNEGEVACMQLGFTGLNSVVSNSEFGYGTGPIWMDDVSCIGNETMLANCSFPGWSVENCGHAEDVAVICSTGMSTTPKPAKEGELRLVDGDLERSGRLEIFHDDQWGTICDDLFDTNDGRVACKQLGYSDVADILTDVPAGTGLILMDNVGCLGTENKLSECDFSGWTINNCGHGEDVGVVCTTHNTSQVPEGSLRLVGGTDELHGRLEIFHDGEWGTVCGNDFNNPDGDVVCRQLGHVGLTRVELKVNDHESASDFPHPNRVWLENVDCTGTEDTLSDCNHAPWGQGLCPHTEDIGILCHESTAGPDLSIRLVNGPTSAEGRLEIFHVDRWGTVCDDHFDNLDGEVVCRQLGFTGVERIVTDDAYGIGSGRIWMDDVACTGSENRLEDCPSRGWGINNCRHPDDVGIVCSDEPQVTTNDGDLRLSSYGATATSNEGRLEVYHNGEWGSVCDDLFGNIDGEVACRQLGFASLISIRSAGDYGTSSTNIWLDNLECDGSEDKLYQCDHVGWGGHNCGHVEDVGLICSAEGINSRCPLDWTENGDYCYYVKAGQIQYSYSEARSACLAQNATLTSIANIEEQNFLNAFVSPYGVYVWIGLNDKVTEGEFVWEDGTPFGSFTNWAGGVLPDNWNGVEHCVHFRRANEVGIWNDLSCDGGAPPHAVQGYICKKRNGPELSIPTPRPSVADGTIRLVGGPTPLEGRIEIFHNNEWGTICDDSFEITEATVACRQLGFTAASSVVTDDSYGYGTGSIWLDDLSCAGSEADIASCGNNGWGVNNCGHTEDVGVVCLNSTTGVETYLGCYRDREDRALDSHLLVRDTMTLETCFANCRSFGDQVVYAALQFSTECRCGAATDDYAVHGVGAESDCSMACGGNSAQKCGGEWRMSVYSLRDSENDVRLVDGTSSNSGRIEIYHEGEWGTVCDDLFSITDASIVCRQLGLGNATTLQSYGSGTGSIWLDDINCSGRETSLHLCEHNGWGNTNCGHGEDVGIACSGRNIPEPGETVRLVGGSNDYEGRVEVLHSGEWGTVCDDYFTLEDANVICRQLGFGEASRVVVDDPYGIGTGTIWLDDVDCSGTETSIQSCGHAGWGSNNCGHSEDVGIICESPSSSTECYTDPIGVDYRGIVAVTSSSKTCQRWTSQSPQEHTRTPTKFPDKGLGDHNYCRNPDNEPGGAWCYTTDPETRWQYCDIGQARTSCDGGGGIAENALRLVGSETRGRLEVYHDGQWGTVCDDDFDLVDGGVACRQLGFTSAVAIEDPTLLAPDTTQTLMDNINCIGTEETLADCPFAGWGIENCGHSEDVILVCSSSEETGTEGSVRLVDGTGDHEGRVEIFHTGEWGTVCDDAWGESAGLVVCKQLGFGGLDHVTVGASFGEGTGEIWMDQVHCGVDVDTLAGCSQSGWGVHNCGHGEDAGVVCIEGSLPPPGLPNSLRLVGGASDLIGRLEVSHDGEWGTVCNDLFDVTDARVACRQLGYGGGEVISGSGGTGQIWLDNVQCTGDESVLTDCAHNGLGQHNCGHSEDVSISCTALPGGDTNEGGLRLVGGDAPNQGRVEVNHDNQWGSICDDTWDIDDSNVVCRQLGFESAESYHPGAYFGQGEGPIWLDNVDCSGSEERLVDCGHLGWASHNCGHGEDAGVTCVLGNGPILSNCPSNMDVVIRSGSQGNSVHWTEPTATSRDGTVVPALFKTHEPGSNFYPGSTLVTYVFLDTIGEGGVIKCTFTVTGTLLDTTSPHIYKCPPDKTQTVELGQDVGNYIWPEPYATDDSGNVTLVSQSHSPGYVFGFGRPTTVTYVFADPSGNQATCSFDVTVESEDTTAPTIRNCPKNINVLLQGDSFGRAVTWNTPSASDASRSPTLLLQSHMSGSMFQPGSTIVTYVFTDPSHNLAKCTFNVNVRSGSVVLDVSMTIDRDFNSALNNPESPEYKALENTVVSTMDDVFDNSDLAGVYSMTEVSRFSRGSIEADCRVHINPAKSSQPQPLGLSIMPDNQNQDIETTILQILQAAASPNGLLGELGVGADSITVIMQTPSATAPTISSCPSTIVMNKKPDGSDVVVSWIEPIATDATGVVPLISKSHSPGSVFDAETTTVTYRFGRTPVDTASCVFTVIVAEDALTVHRCPSDIKIKDKTLKDGQGTPVTWIEPYVTFMKQNVSLISQSHKPGDIFATGLTVVSYVFSTKGVEKSCVFEVLINTDGKGGTGQFTSGNHSVSVAGLVIAILVGILLLVVIIAAIILYRRRRSAGHGIEMQASSGFENQMSPFGTSETKAFF